MEETEPGGTGWNACAPGGYEGLRTFLSFAVCIYCMSR